MRSPGRLAAPDSAGEDDPSSLETTVVDLQSIMALAERAHHRLAQHAEAHGSYKLQNAELNTEIRALRVKNSEMATQYTEEQAKVQVLARSVLSFSGKTASWEDIAQRLCHTPQKTVMDLLHYQQQQHEAAQRLLSAELVAISEKNASLSTDSAEVKERNTLLSADLAQRKAEKIRDDNTRGALYNGSPAARALRVRLATAEAAAKVERSRHLQSEAAATDVQERVSSQLQALQEQLFQACREKEEEVVRREVAEAAAAANSRDAERYQEQLAHAEAKHEADLARGLEDQKALSQELNRAQASIIKLETAQAAVATHQKEADILKLQEQVQELQRVHETTSEAAQAERAELTRRLRRSTSDAKDTIKAFVGRLAAAEKALEEAPQPAEVTELHRSLSQARQHIQDLNVAAKTKAQKWAVQKQDLDVKLTRSGNQVTRLQRQTSELKDEKDALAAKLPTPTPTPNPTPTPAASRSSRARSNKKKKAGMAAPQVEKAQTVAEAVAQAEGMQPASGAIEVGEAVQVAHWGQDQGASELQSSTGDTQGLGRTSWSKTEWEVVSGPLCMQSWDMPHHQRKRSNKHGLQF